jgi:hypothetical protein
MLRSKSASSTLMIAVFTFWTTVVVSLSYWIEGALCSMCTSDWGNIHRMLCLTAKRRPGRR